MNLRFVIKYSVFIDPVTGEKRMISQKILQHQVPGPKPEWRDIPTENDDESEKRALEELGDGFKLSPDLTR